MIKLRLIKFTLIFSIIILFLVNYKTTFIYTQNKNITKQTQIKKEDDKNEMKENVLTATISSGNITKTEDKREINLVVTFYTGSADENGGYKNANITATGKTLSRGMCASNNFDFNTKIQTEEFGTLIVEDRGNPKYIRQVDENTYRIDVYVSDKKIANKLGVKKIKGYIIK